MAFLILEHLRFIGGVWHASLDYLRLGCGRDDFGSSSGGCKERCLEGRVDLGKLTADGPVLVRLTCACSGCDAELPYFQKLQAAYKEKGLTTLAVFQEEPASLESYVAQKDIQFLWLADPKGALWKTFEAKTMPTNVLLDKGGKVVKVVAGCTKDGKNAQALSSEIAKLLNTQEAQITETKK